MIQNPQDKTERKLLTLIRHAKSSWDYPDLIDKERPISKRGRKSVELMSEHNAKLLNQIEMFYCSTAERAVQTMDLFSRLNKIPLRKINYHDSLYIFDKGVLANFLKRLNGNLNSVALIGHNPAFTDLVNYFVEDQIENVPTCAMVRIKFECQSWKDVTNCEAKLVYFDSPKNHK